MILPLKLFFFVLEFWSVSTFEQRDGKLKSPVLPDAPDTIADVKESRGYVPLDLSKECVGFILKIKEI